MPSPASAAAAARRGSPEKPTYERQRQWQASLRGGTMRMRRHADRPPPSSPPPSGGARDPELLHRTRYSHDDMRRGALRQSTERQRARAIARAELECIRRARMRAPKDSSENKDALPKAGEHMVTPTWVPVDRSVDDSSSDREEDLLSESGATPWISPRRYYHGFGSKASQDWDELWDSGVSAAAAAASTSAGSAETSDTGNTRTDTPATAALLRAQRGDSRAPVPTASDINASNDMPKYRYRQAERRKTSLVALEKRIAEAEKRLDMRERFTRSDSHNAPVATPRRTRSAGEDARDSAAAIKRLARARVVSIELTEDGLEQEQLWKSRRRQHQQQYPRGRPPRVASGLESSPSDWLAPPSLSATRQTDHEFGSHVGSPAPAQHAGATAREEEEKFTQHDIGKSSEDALRKVAEHLVTPKWVSVEGSVDESSSVRGDDDHDEDDDLTSGDGLHVEPEASSSADASEMMPKNLRCPSGHDLEAFETPMDGYKCDECGAVTTAQHLMQSCRLCEHDVCEECVRNRFQPRRSMLDEVSMSTDAIGNDRGQRDFPFDLSSIGFEPSRQDSDLSEMNSGGGLRRKQQARSSRLIERIVALLILSYFAMVYVW